MRVALGPPAKGESDDLNQQDHTQWETVHREKNVFRCSDYVFETSVGSSDGLKKGYRWQKDRSKWFSTVYTCVDDQGRQLARMLSGGAFNWKKAGELEMEEDLPKELEELLTVGALGIWVAEGCSSYYRGYGRDKPNEQVPNEVQKS
jgi:hypothetical protein